MTKGGTHSVQAQLEKLIDETRELRRDLHALVERLRDDRTHWERDAAALRHARGSRRPSGTDSARISRR